MDKKKKTYKQNITAENPIEAIRSMGQGVVSSVANEGQKAVSDLWEQLLVRQKGEASRESGDMKEGEELVLSKKTERIDPGIDWRNEIIHGETRIRKQNDKAIEYKVEEILVELRRIAETTKELKLEFAEIAIEKVPVNAGAYHLNFFEWMLSTLTAARQKVESSRNWLAAMTSKKQKQGYWNMFKKHGTSFGLSNERVVATQTG